MELLIKEVRIIDAEQDLFGDVYIKDGQIEEIGSNLDIDCEKIMGEGKILLPSFIDLHCHFRDPGLTYKEDLLSGSMAALRGGYTAVNLMANTNPICSTMDTVEYILSKSREIGLIDIHQTVSITRNFDGEDISHLNDIDNSVRFISDDGKGIVSNKVMLEAMIFSQEKGFTIISHVEDEELVKFDSRISENLMTVRDIILAKESGAHLHIAHVSTKEAMAEIIRAKKNISNITCEVAPHHIALTEDTPYLVNPPLRQIEDTKFLVQAIKEGWVDMIATDHAPHSIEDKQKGAPGISGLESAFSVCYTTLVKEGHISLGKLSELMSKNPGKIMGLNKGLVKKGYDGDLVLVDIEEKHKINSDNFKSKGKNTPFDGMEFWGMVQSTIKGGKVLYKGDLQ